MSDTGKDTVAPKEKDGAEKRGRGRPRKHPQVLRCSVRLSYVIKRNVVLVLFVLCWCMHVLGRGYGLHFCIQHFIAHMR